jgi:hypothetical protein
MILGSIFLGSIFGFVAWFLVRYLLAGLYAVDQNERAVKTIFGRAERIPNVSTLDDPIADYLRPEEKERSADAVAGFRNCPGSRLSPAGARYSPC